MSLNLFDKILYINLKHRKDRKKSFLKEAKRSGIKKVQRVDGCFDLFNGAKGCVLSHIKALSIAKPTERTLILEDDSLFIDNQPLIDKQILNFFKAYQTNWDVFFLGGRYLEVGPEENVMFQRVYQACGAYAYAVNGSYISTLKNCFLEAYKMMEEDVTFVDTKRRAGDLDCYWHRLQKKDRWYAGQKSLVCTSESISNIWSIDRALVVRAFDSGKS